MTFIAAAVQMSSSDVIADNIAQAEALIAEAVKKGATLVALPENAFFMRREGMKTDGDVAMTDHIGIKFAQGAAKQHGIWLLAGSVRAMEKGMKVPANRSVLIAPDGRIAASYDKIHLFDVSLPGGHHYEESKYITAGDRGVAVQTELGTIGLSVCYDLRFPNLYRALALAGADILVIPSAFTKPTGEAHWHTLTRARAIENACFVIAPAQCGLHPGGRETYGHSLIIDPWGNVLAEALEDKPCVITAEIDVARGVEIRAQLPVLAHHREPGKIRVIKS